MLYCRAVGTGPGRGASVNATQVFGRNSSKTFSFERALITASTSGFLDLPAALHTVPLMQI